MVSKLASYLKYESSLLWMSNKLVLMKKMMENVYLFYFIYVNVVRFVQHT